MHKELNPDLFSDKSKEHGVPAAPRADSGPLSLDRQVFELKIQNHNLNEQLHKLTIAFGELTKNSTTKFERTQQSLLRLDQNHTALAYEMGQKFNQIGQKISERKIIDAKIQEMVDKHAHIVKSFEVRMNHLQKLLVEKEALAAAMHTALNEARMEISRLKRS